MRLITFPLSKKEIAEIKREYGDYFKLTVDLEKRCLVAGGELHADGEKILLQNGSKQDDIWGGGINLKDKVIDTTAVLNIRPRLSNTSLEILDPKRREKFIKLVKEIFDKLWS